MTATGSPRLTVALTFDHDAISSEVRRGDGPMTISRGEFGPRVGARRVLELLDREGIPSTWVVPRPTLQHFPPAAGAGPERAARDGRGAVAAAHFGGDRVVVEGEGDGQAR